MLHFDWMTVENAVRERGRRPVDVFLFRCGFQGIHNFLPQHLGQNPARPVLAPWIKLSTQHANTMILIDS
jgi:hypothetical protein